MNVKKNLFLIIVALLAVVAFALLFLNNDNAPNLSQNGEIKSTETSPVVSTSEEYKELTFPDNTLDTSDWETYRNEEFGFEVRYPGGWGVYDKKKPFSIRPPTKKDPNDDGGIYFFSSGYTLDELIENANPRDRVLKQKFVINETLGIVFDAKLGVWSENYPYPDTRDITKVYVLDTRKSRISFYVPSIDSYRTKVLEKILLSFKLIK